MSSQIREEIADEIYCRKHTSAEKCGCHGSGWILTNYDVYYQCPYHFKGQDHPEYAIYKMEMQDWYDSLTQEEKDTIERESKEREAREVEKRNSYSSGLPSYDDPFADE
jgi:hypothetical protein